MHDLNGVGYTEKVHYLQIFHFPGGILIINPFSASVPYMGHRLWCPCLSVLHMGHDNFNSFTWRLSTAKQKN